MSNQRDYLGAIFPKPGDKVDYGVRGMKWGVRRPRSVLRKEAAKRSTSTATKPAEAKSAAGSSHHDGAESSSARYNRLAAQAKAGKASDMTEADLKFFNARTDALAKVNKLNENNPGWLAATAKKVVQTSAERQMQSVSDALADKYIGNPIKDAIKGADKKD